MNLLYRKIRTLQKNIIGNMTNKPSIVPQIEIENLIFTFRGIQVMLDRHLAELYEVETRVINQAVKRNRERFPPEFCIQLTDEEFSNWKSQIVMSNRDKMGLRKSPYVFSEQGVAMLSAVLRSETAVKVSIKIMNAFVEMRKIVLGNAALFQRLDKVELKQIDADQKFEQLFKALESREQQPEKGIFFEGQVFDAYVFVADLIKKANLSIILIDNYIDETVLTLLSKREMGVAAAIYTRQLSSQLQLDLNKHNKQYPAIEIKTITNTHDRFLLLDRTELYHIGASLKDLGKKWFAFSRMDDFATEILNRIQQKND